MRGYVLVIAEKPKAAQKIAQALSNGRAKLYRHMGIPYWVFKYNGDTYIVAPAAGHLFTLSTSESGYPVVSYRWVPRWFEEKEATHLKKFYSLLQMLCRNASIYINACDYDIEGSVIGYLIILFLGDIRRAYRVKFSSLTPREIRAAFRNVLSLDWEMIEAGLCRHELDWLWGINLSRAISNIVSKALGRRVILSAGRVQSPTLAEATRRIIERRLHIPEPLFYPRVCVEILGRTVCLEYCGDPIRSRSEALRAINAIKRSSYAVVSKIRREFRELEPPHPFNLSDLQSEAYRILKLSPAKTQRLAEELYLDALISYPRTNSQKLPPTIDNRSILEFLRTSPIHGKLVNELLRETRGILIPNNGPKDDPAHPAIYPTGNVPRCKTLSSRALKLYDIIVRRYLATFSRPATVQCVEVLLSVAGLEFRIRSCEVVREGWLKYYPYIDIGTRIPGISSLREGMRLRIVRASIVTRYTPPPPPPTKLSLLKWMESVGIGTESTRAEIIETLFKRKYLYYRGKSVDVSDLGLAVAYLLSELFPDIVDVGLTRKFEEYMELIRRGILKREQVVLEAKKFVSTIVNNVKKNESTALEILSKYMRLNSDNSCPICGRKAIENGYCKFHSEALKKIYEYYGRWREAGYTWSEYLSKLLRLRSTGYWIREVVEHILKSRTLSY